MSTEVQKPQLLISPIELQTMQAQTPQKSELTGRCLTFETHGCIKQHVIITSSQGDKYFLSYHRIKKPDIKLSLGHHDGPLSAVAYIHSWSRCYRVGLGNDEVSKDWVKYKTKVWPKRPTFEWKGETYILGRAFKDENGEKLEKSKTRWYFSVRDGTGGWVALYSPCKVDGKKVGVLKLANGISEEVEQIIILGIASWKAEMKRAG